LSARSSSAGVCSISSKGSSDHHVLNLHHVYEAMGQSIFDWLFLLSGVVFIIGGSVAVRSARNVVS